MLRIITACLIFMLTIVLEPAFAQEHGNNWYAPKLIRLNHGAPEFSFLEGQWQTPDKKFTETWSRAANGHLIGLRTFIGDNNKEECYFFGFQGTPTGERPLLRRLDLSARFEDSLAKEIFQGAWENPMEHKGSISYFSIQGLRTTSKYDCPEKDKLNIEIETDENGKTIKKTVHLVRVR
ncbi:MAG TPA: hypothetical protein V6C97_18710 [Oculatellaceae cyanobacterium]